jgi:hypothetical protein
MENEREQSAAPCGISALDHYPGYAVIDGPGQSRLLRVIGIFKVRSLCPNKARSSHSIAPDHA